jgi:hypothetical protein
MELKPAALRISTRRSSDGVDDRAAYQHVRPKVGVLVHAVEPQLHVPVAG